MRYREAKNGLGSYYCPLCDLFPSHRRVPTKTEREAIEKEVAEIAKPLWAEYDRQHANAELVKAMEKSVRPYLKEIQKTADKLGIEISVNIKPRKKKKKRA